MSCERWFEITYLIFIFAGVTVSILCIGIGIGKALNIGKELK